MITIQWVVYMVVVCCACLVGSSFFFFHLWLSKWLSKRLSIKRRLLLFGRL